MGLMDLFKMNTATGSPALPRDKPVDNTEQNQNQPGAAGTATPNPQLDVAAQNQQDKNKGPASPLDQFKNLWQDEPSEGSQQPNKDGTGATPATPEHPYSQKKLVEAAKKMDFSRTVPPELLAKAFPGGDATSIGAVLNNIGRMAFAAGGHLAVQISRGEVDGFKTSFESELPNKLRQHSVSSTEYSNPAYKHPALKPVVDATRQKIADKYPDATPQEIEQLTSDYIGAMISEVSGQDPAKKVQQSKAARDVQAQQAKGEFDWSKEFDQ